MKKLASKGLLMSALICGNVLLGGNAVFAEEVHEYDLDAMVVTATRTMKQIQEVPSSVSVVTAKDIEERNITSVPEALQTLPGVYKSQAIQGGIQLRGFGSGDILVLVDGLQMNYPFNSTVDNHGDFHEDCVNIIMKDLIKLMDPKYIEVTGIFTPRGGISIWPYANYGKPGTKYEKLAEQRFATHE